MPRARSDMWRIREVLRLPDKFGASQQQIADARRLPRSTVRDYLERLRASGLRYVDVLGWTNVELEERLFPPLVTSVRPVPAWRHISRELSRRGVTLRLLWEECRGRQARDGAALRTGASRDARRWWHGPVQHVQQSDAAGRCGPQQNRRLVAWISLEWVRNDRWG